MNDLQSKILHELRAGPVAVEFHGGKICYPASGLSSMDLIQVAVLLEKAFGIRFHLPDINESNFSDLEALARLIKAARS